MGTILIESFLNSHAITPSQLTITNRTLSKAQQLASQYPGIKIVEDATAVINNSDWVFLCTKPLQMLPIIKEVNPELSRNHLLVSITSPLLVEELESLTDANVIRFIPSIVNRALEGPSLVTFGKKVSPKLEEEFLSLARTISRPEVIDDRITRVASDLGCCGPAFVSYLVERMIKAAVEETNITEEEATNIMESMLIGYGELLRQKHFTLATLQEKVTVPGGVTGVGLEVLRAEVGDQFNKLFQKTHEKFNEDRYHIKNQLGKEKSRD
ncbi:MAG: late competence protein ComER [Bacillus sp. (in: Bacteria)]|nr:late competence protein ComER [Bacillus sp. (in: firmicutes)]